MIKSSEKIALRELRQIYSEQRGAIRNRLRDFSHIKPSGYFYELVYCLLTPQSSAINADKAIEQLKERNFKHKNFDPKIILGRKDCYIRFHKNKSRYLITVKEQFPIIIKQLNGRLKSEEMRLWLVKNVKGLGWKESSHFLRNIGYRDFAILDRHILRNLVRLHVIRSLPKTLNAKNYLQIEEIFRKFSKRVNIPLDELDLLFWSMETGKIMK